MSTSKTLDKKKPRKLHSYIPSNWFPKLFSSLRLNGAAFTLTPPINWTNVTHNFWLTSITRIICEHFSNSYMQFLLCTSNKLQFHCLALMEWICLGITMFEVVILSVCFIFISNHTNGTCYFKMNVKGNFDLVQRF